MLFALSGLWEGSFFFVAIAVDELPPITTASLRIGLAALAMNLLLRAIKINIPAVPVTSKPAPHARTIVSTLHHVFVLPMPANAGNTKSRARKVSKQTTKKRSSATKRKSAIRTPEPKLTDEQHLNSGRYEPPRNANGARNSASAGTAPTLPSLG